MVLTGQYQELLDQASKAISERKFFAAYPEHPKAYAEDGMVKGLEWFRNQADQPFTELLQTGEEGFKGDEVSPYTQELLNIKYPTFTVDNLISKANAANVDWRYAFPSVRAAILIDSLERIKKRFFEIAYATMHTTGQPFMMSFQASGPHAADRALEAIVLGYRELNQFPAQAEWEKPMGKFSINVKKNWKAIGRGINLVIGCSTFPVWNSVPGIYAGLITGNPVIVKPHPGSVLPIAIVVGEIQKALHSNGFNPDVIQLAVDTNDEPVTKKIAEHPDVKIIDYTGGNTFGDYIESLPGKVTFTEKAGVNSVILDSVNDLDAVMQNLAFSVSLYSGQMCTAPQNFFVPEDGVKVGDEYISFEATVQKFADSLKALITNPKMGPGTLGAIQSLDTCERVMNARDMAVTIVLDSMEITNEEFPNARTASPLVAVAKAEDFEIYSHEMFGPVVLFIKTRDTYHSVQLARKLALTKGALSCGAYTVDEPTHDYIEREMEDAFTPVAFNLTGPIWMNQNAAFSDFHVTGGNPAGNATFTDAAYLVKRFVWVGHKEGRG